MTIKMFFWSLAKRTPIIKSIIAKYEREILDLRMALVKHCYPELQLEANYILQNGWCMYPYKSISATAEIRTGFDKGCRLPYVLHNGKKLYFPKSYSAKKCAKSYRSLTELDCILGGSHLEKQPHQYQTETFKIDKGDVLADVGCAEALLALDTIDVLSKAYLFEGDAKWIPALRATFKEYADKVVIINKYVSGVDSESTITLKSALRGEVGKSVFIKMDIEGAEMDVLKGSKAYLTSATDIKIACCTYHHQDDPDEILQLFDEMGFLHEFSDGFMYLKGYDDKFTFPYFRRGVLRGWK